MVVAWFSMVVLLHQSHTSRGRLDRENQALMILHALTQVYLTVARLQHHLLGLEYHASDAPVLVTGIGTNEAQSAHCSSDDKSAFLSAHCPLGTISHLEAVCFG